LVQSLPLLVETLRSLAPMLAEWSYVHGRADPRSLACFATASLPDGCVLGPSLLAYHASAAAAPAREPLAADAQLRHKAVFTSGIVPFHSCHMLLMPLRSLFVCLFADFVACRGIEMLANALNICPPLWALQFCTALQLDMTLYQEEQAAAAKPAVSACRFGGWGPVAASIDGYLAQLSQLHAAIAALGPWHLVESHDSDSAELARVLPAWTTAAIHATIFP
jgi:hypothetical protein